LSELLSHQIFSLERRRKEDGSKTFHPYHFKIIEVNYINVSIYLTIMMGVKLKYSYCTYCVND